MTTLKAAMRCSSRANLKMVAYLRGAAQTRVPAPGGSKMARMLLPFFFILTFGLFWLAAPLASALWVGLIASFAPSVVAIVLTALASGGAGVLALVSKLGRWR